MNLSPKSMPSKVDYDLPPKVDYDLMYHSIFGKDLPITNLKLIERELPDIPASDIPASGLEPLQDHRPAYGFVKNNDESVDENQDKYSVYHNLFGKDLPLFIKLASTKTLPDIPVSDIPVSDILVSGIPVSDEEESAEPDEETSVEPDEETSVEPDEEASAEPEEEESSEPEEEESSEPEEEESAEPADYGKGFMANTDLDRAEAMIMQIFGGDENALSNIRTRDTNRESALRNAVISERNDAFTREINKLEKEREESARQEKENEERKFKKLEAIKDYKDAVAKFKHIKTQEAPGSQEYQLAENQLEEASKKLGLLGEDLTSEVTLLKNSKLEGKTNRTIKKEVSEVGIAWRNKKGGQFSESEKKNALQTLERLKAEPYVTTEDSEKIQAISEAIESKPSKEEVDTERERQKREILKAVNDFVGGKLTEKGVATLHKYNLPTEVSTYTKKYSKWKAFEADYANKYEFVDYKGVKL